MKQLKSFLRNFRQLFERTITIREIAEPLASFDSERSAASVRAFMAENGFDEIGIRESGAVTGFARRDDLGDGKLGDYRNSFNDPDVLHESAPIGEAFRKLPSRASIYVTVFGQVGSIVTPGDLQKAPVRMLLFGLISLIEMQTLRLIRERFQNKDGWTALLEPKNVRKARREYGRRRRRNEEIDLAECLDLSDKFALLVKDEKLFACVGSRDRAERERFHQELKDMRNNLAHGHDIIGSDLPKLANLVERATHYLDRLEGASPVAP